MNHSIYLVVFVSLLVQFSNAVPLSLTLYHGTNYLGESVEFTQTNTKAECVNTLFGSVNSKCATGFWIYSGSNTSQFTIGLNENRTCSGFSSGESYSSVTAVRRLGPADTTDKTIVFYSGSGVTDYLINEKLADANVTIPLTLASAAIITYGSSSWTLFENYNFEGKSVCLETPDVVRLSKIYDPHINMTKVGSLIKGCDLPNELLSKLRRRTN